MSNFSSRSKIISTAAKESMPRSSSRSATPILRFSAGTRLAIMAITSAATSVIVRFPSPVWSGNLGSASRPQAPTLSFVPAARARSLAAKLRDIGAAGNALDHDELAEILLDRFGIRQACPARSARDIPEHGRPGGELRPLADIDVLDDAHTRAENDEILQRHAAADARLRHDDAMAADLHIASSCRDRKSTRLNSSHS